MVVCSPAVTPSVAVSKNKSCRRSSCKEGKNAIGFQALGSQVHGLKRSLLSQPVLQKRMTSVEIWNFENSFAVLDSGGFSFRARVAPTIIGFPQPFDD